MKLRPYQTEACDAVLDALAQEECHPLISLPTGSGKSIVQAEIVRRVLEDDPAARIFCVTHRRELIAQNAAKIQEMCPGIPVGIYSAGIKRRDVRQRVICAQIQSCYHAVGNMLAVGPVKLVIIDEAHLFPHTGTGRYRTWWESMVKRCPDLRAVGMSATPYRTDSGMLTDDHVFSDIVYEAGLVRLIKEGYLSPLVSRPTDDKAQADLSGVKKRGGEFIPGQLASAMDQDPLIQASLDDAMALAADRKCWLVFCSGVKHAENVRDALNGRGITAKTVTGATPENERDAILSDLHAGRIRAVTNADVLTTGFDCPRIDVILLMRPTMSPGLYCQMLGRAMRLFDGKKDALILDYGGNIERHGTLEAIQVLPKSESEGENLPPRDKPCAKCGCWNHPCRRECLACGHPFVTLKEINHDEKSSDLAIIGDEDRVPGEPRWEAVTAVEYAVHNKRGRPPSMKVTYRLQGRPTLSEWICFEHDGWARTKAMRWWRKRDVTTEVPKTTRDALARAPHDLDRPTHICIRYDPGRYPAIVDYAWSQQLPIRVSSYGMTRGTRQLSMQGDRE